MTHPFATQTFAQYASEFAHQPMSAAVTHHAKRAVIDWFASLYPGLGMPAVRLLEVSLDEDLGHGKARLMDGRLATVRAAALIHGTASHAAELDDSFREAMYHPGAATIAAAWAVAQAMDANGQQFLKALVLGYEVSTRIGMAMGRAHYQYWHSTGTMGTFGAAAAAGYLYGLNEDEFANALALSTTFTAGLQQSFRLESMVKPLHAGRAAEAGVMAAQLARQGMRCSLDVLEGSAGLGQAMSSGPDWSGIGATLGKDFHITRLTFKNHVGCGHTFPAIDGALALKDEHRFEVGDIDLVELGVYLPTLEISGHINPTTADEAKFSLHYMVASALVHGSVRLSAFEPDRLSCHRTRGLMSRISASLDAEADGGFPDRRAARVIIALRNGQRLTRYQSDRKGDPELPLTDADLEGKLLELAGPTMGESAARKLLDQIWQLDGPGSLPW